MTVVDFPRRRHVHCPHCEMWQPSETALAAHVRWECPKLDRGNDSPPEGAA